MEMLPYLKYVIKCFFGSSHVIFMVCLFVDLDIEAGSITSTLQKGIAILTGVFLYLFDHK